MRVLNMMRAVQEQCCKTSSAVRWGKLSLAAACTLVCLGAAGCGEKLQDLKQTVTEKVGQVVEKAEGAVQKVEQKVAPQPEGIELDAGGALRAEACYATLTQVRAGEPAILQLSTFEQGKRETYPSVYVRAEVSAASLADLQGKKLQAQVYLQNKADGPIWQTPVGGHVELTVLTATPDRITCELIQGQLVNAADGSTLPIKGKFFAKLPSAT